MKKNFIYKFLISFIVSAFLFSNVCFGEPTFVSLSPALTETMFAINAQSMLKGVSTACTYPEEAQKIDKIGDNFFINQEKILSIKPDYILALDSSAFAVNKYKKFGIKPLCFQNQDIESIFKNIWEIGKMTGKTKEAEKVVEFAKKKILLANKKHNKKILYLVQTTPMISIGKKSFISDIISKSGNISVTKDLNSFYPIISEEYAIAQKPDIIVLSFFSTDERIKKLFPDAKIIFINEEQNDIINRPGPRVYKSVEFFSDL